MSLTLKAEIETWAAALDAYDEQDFDKALGLFSLIADSSKILTNMGLIHATIGEHDTAVEHFVAATNLDSYLSIAYFQCGVSNFLLERYDLALLNFEDAHLHLRGNEAINYDQIGLKFKLFSAEIMFNKGLTELTLGYVEQGIADMREASKQKVTDEHGVIDEAIRDRGEGYTVFSIPVGVLYRPSENKLKNSKSKDYIGKAKLVAASDSNDAFTEFTGVRRLQQGSEENPEDKDVDGRPGVESFAQSKSTIPPASTDHVTTRPTHERSKTPLQPATVARPRVTLASRRTQSVSNPARAPPTPTTPDLPRNNSIKNNTTTMLGRSNTTHGIARNATDNVVTPLRIKIPQGNPAGRRAASSRAVGDTGAAAPGGASLTLPSLPLATDRLPPSQAQSSAYQSQRQSPTTVTSLPFYQEPRPQPQPVVHEQNQRQQQSSTAWMLSASGQHSRASSSTSTTSGLSRSSSRGKNSGSNMGNGGTVRIGKARRRPTARRVVVDDYEDEGDDGFVTGGGEYDGEPEMSTIRVKLHYQGDVRGMTIAPNTTTFDAFVERVTAKFGTSLCLKFVDEDGTKISLRDESDFDLAIETARENARGRSDGKIEVWCMDVY